MRNLEGDEMLAIRRRTTMALVVVGQMLGEGVVKGGSAMALRYGSSTRFTIDLDAARTSSSARFRSSFEERLRDGWGGFTGRLVERTPPKPKGVPGAYVMKPFEVKLDFEGRPWCTVPFELGHNEIGDADHPEFRLAQGIAEMFTAVGLPAPTLVPVMAVDHQIALKLHAVSAPGSDRARDLVDLQLLAAREELDLWSVGVTCTRLFGYRKAHPWPPVVTAGAGWTTLYEKAAEGLDVDVAVGVAGAIQWLNGFINRIDRARRSPTRE